MSSVAVRADVNRTTLAALLGTVGMLFAAFTAAYLERSVGHDWVPIELPGVVTWSTIAILASSVTIELASRRASRGWLLATIVLGLLFLTGQLAAWHALRAQGLYLPTQPYASFFYTLTAVHGLHLLGGIVALGSAWSRLSRLRLAAVYWHFVGGVWIYLLLVLFSG